MRAHRILAGRRRAGVIGRGFVLAAAAWLVSAAAAQAQCPENSHEIARERVGTELRIKCACDANYMAHGRRCIPKVAFKGNWDDPAQKLLVQETLNRVTDRDLRNWIAAHVGFERWHRDDGGAVSANGPDLRFRNEFFDSTTSDDWRVNLLVWEAGKVFLTDWQNEPLPGGGTLGAWFGGFWGEHAGVIRDMRAANHGTDNLNWVKDPDMFAAFADVFRAEALQIALAKEDPRKDKWDTVRAEFRNRVQSLLRKQ